MTNTTFTGISDAREPTLEVSSKNRTGKYAFYYHGQKVFDPNDTQEDWKEKSLAFQNFSTKSETIYESEEEKPLCYKDLAQKAATPLTYQGISYRYLPLYKRLAEEIVDFKHSKIDFFTDNGSDENTENSRPVFSPERSQSKNYYEKVRNLCAADGDNTTLLAMTDL